MHMADALLSPAVGGAMWATSAGTLAYCGRKVRQDLDERKVPLMGVLGAFVFAAQMINFTIPGTGSSGHLGGGLLLAVILGPHAAFLVIASVLVVQALFFADGGLLALGCNIFNLGFFPAFVAWPLVYRPIAPSGAGQGRIFCASLAAAVVGLQLGALSVVLETVISGVSALPFATFALLMQPIHLAIGIVEGVATAVVVGFVATVHPEIVGASAPRKDATGGRRTRPVLALFLGAALIAGGLVSWFASDKPDGLEWAIERTAGTAGLGPPKGGGIHGVLASLQKTIAPLPDYSFGTQRPAPAVPGHAGSQQEPPGRTGEARLATSLSGIVGGGVTLAVAFLIGVVLHRRASSR